MKYPILMAAGMAAILAACSGKPEPAQSNTATTQEIQQAIQHAKEAAAQAGKTAGDAAAKSNENIQKANEAAAAALANLPADTKPALDAAAAMTQQKQQTSGATEKAAQ
jgi:starvation-inducible outer membrane lipoprotein